MGLDNVGVLGIVLSEEFFAKEGFTAKNADVLVIFLDEYFSFLDEEE
jgi:hypothetical protein